MVSPIRLWLQTVRWGDVQGELSTQGLLMAAVNQSVAARTLQVSVSQRMFRDLASKRMGPINELAKCDPEHDNYTLYAVGADFAEPVYGVLRALAVPGTDHTTEWEEHDFLRDGHTVSYRGTKLEHFMVRLEVGSTEGWREFNASLVNHTGSFVLSIDVVPN